MNIVITGGPCSGKTTLINALEKKGIHVIHEVAIKVISQLIDQFGADKALKWRQGNVVEFQSLIMERQWQEEDLIDPAEVTVLDRGLLDNIAYLTHKGVTIPTKMKEKIYNSFYDIIFICETLPNYQTRTETGRFESQDESRVIQMHISNTYQIAGYTTVFLPAIPLHERLDYLFTKLDQRFNINLLSSNTR